MTQGRQSKLHTQKVVTIVINPGPTESSLWEVQQCAYSVPNTARFSAFAQRWMRLWTRAPVIWRAPGETIKCGDFVGVHFHAGVTRTEMRFAHVLNDATKANQHLKWCRLWCRMRWTENNKYDCLKKKNSFTCVSFKSSPCSRSPSFGYCIECETALNRETTVFFFVFFL